MTTATPQNQKTADPVVKALIGVPVTGVRFTESETFLTRRSAEKLAAALRVKGLISNPLEDKTKEKDQ